MTMHFSEPTSWSMVVMDGRRCVAKAKKVALGGWMLTTMDGCWTDPRAREPLNAQLPNGGLWPRYPQFMHVKTKHEARKIMKSLTNTGKGNDA